MAMAMAVMVVGGMARVFVFGGIVMATTATGMMWGGGMRMRVRMRMSGHDVLDLRGGFGKQSKARTFKMCM
jgi:hypothetical protein